MNINYYENFIALKVHVQNELCVEVIQKPGADDAWYPLLNKIYVNQNLKFRERFFTLMHEAGHAIIDRDRKIKNIFCFNKNRPDNVRTKRDYVHVMSEEIMAWNYGKMIVKNLGLKYNDFEYERYMTDAIMSYTRDGLNSVYGKEMNANIIWTRYV